MAAKKTPLTVRADVPQNLKRDDVTEFALRRDVSHRPPETLHLMGLEDFKEEESFH